jgi:hypothetical protein
MPVTIPFPPILDTILSAVNFGNIVLHRHYWLTSCCLLVGSLDVAYCCLLQICKVEVLQLQLDLLVLSHWFFVCFFILFSSTFQVSSPTPAVRHVLAFWRVEILHPFLLQLCKVEVLHPQLDILFHFAGLRSCTHNWTCNSVGHHSQVSFSTMVSFLFVVCCLLFTICR